MRDEPSYSPPPQGNYVPARRHGDLIFTSGMTPRQDGVLLHAGKVSMNVPIETYGAAVELATQNCIFAAEAQLTPNERLSTVLNLIVYVNADQQITLHSRLADFASGMIDRRFGGVPSRAAIGVSSLPGDATVEVSMVAAAAQQ